MTQAASGWATHRIRQQRGIKLPKRESVYPTVSVLFSILFYFVIFRQRGREGEREGEKHQCAVASCMPPTGDLACDPGMCPDWESNWQPFGLQAGTQCAEPHQPGPKGAFLAQSFELFFKETTRRRILRSSNFTSACHSHTHFWNSPLSKGTLSGS